MRSGRVIILATIGMLFAAALVSCGSPQLAGERGGTAEKVAGSVQTESSYVFDATPISEKQGWALTGDRLDWTADAGQTWRDITPEGAKAANINAVFFANDLFGWVEVTNEEAAGVFRLVVYSTQDGGTTWTVHPMDFTSTHYGTNLAASLYFLDSKEGWLSMTEATSSAFSIGELYHTTDGGATWSRLTAPVAGDVRFEDSSNGWMVGGAAQDDLYTTSDGGSTWRPVKLEVPKEFEGTQTWASLPTPCPSGSESLAATYAATDQNPKSGVGLYTMETSQEVWTLDAAITSPSDLAGTSPTTCTPSGLWLWVQPDGRYVYEVGDKADVSRSPADGTAKTLVALNTATDALWAVSRGGSCNSYKTDCHEVSELITSSDQGQTWDVLTPP